MTATTGRYSDPAYLVSVAPMMACTDRHCRLFLRLIAPGVRLYTEMITAQALVHGDAGRWLRHDPREHPVALQLGGADPDLLAAAARLAEAAGYAEINLNVGCPSDRVRDGAFGACLMKDASRVAACVAAMRGAVSVPVTVKTRIGVDDCDSYEFLRDFVGNVAAAGSDTFIVHARKAWLTGLSPHENRTIPPLRHEVVARLRTDFPRLKLISNGGLNDLGLIRQQLAAGIDGVMIGRKAYADPVWLAGTVAALLGRRPPDAGHVDRVLEALVDYAEREVAAGERPHRITRHLQGLFRGQPGARDWRRLVTLDAQHPRFDLQTLLRFRAAA